MIEVGIMFESTSVTLSLVQKYIHLSQLSIHDNNKHYDIIIYD